MGASRRKLAKKTPEEEAAALRRKEEEKDKFLAEKASQSQQAAAGGAGGAGGPLSAAEAKRGGGGGGALQGPLDEYDDDDDDDDYDDDDVQYEGFGEQLSRIAARRARRLQGHLSQAGRTIGSEVGELELELVLGWAELIYLRRFHWLSRHSLHRTKGFAYTNTHFIVF